jgi:hypothetical protein
MSGGHALAGKVRNGKGFPDVQILVSPPEGRWDTVTCIE